MDESRALEALRGILARPEFTPREASWWELFWAAIWDLLWDFVLWVISPVRKALAGQLAWWDLALLALALGVIAAGIWFVLRTVRAGVVRDAGAAVREAARRRERSDRLWAEAHELAAAGRYVEAVRALYLSALYALEERAVLAVQEGLTNREHAERLARTRPGAGEAFSEVVQRYDRLRYGGLPADAAAFGELSTLVERARTL
jgi:hypothetical protein